RRLELPARGGGGGVHGSGRWLCAIRSCVPGAAQLLGLDRARGGAGSRKGGSPQLRHTRTTEPAPTRGGEHAMSRSLLVKPDLSPEAQQVHRVTPASAGWRYVGFEVFDLPSGGALERSVEGREQCVVHLSGRAAVRVGTLDFGTLGSRRTPFEGKPFAVYVAAGAALSVTAASSCELAVCSAPAKGAVP